MIDAQGFRANVAIVLINDEGKVFWGRRFKQTSWQFPQGGVDKHEAPLVAMYRERREEIGLRPQGVELIAVTQSWLRYRLPKQLIRRGVKPRCIGQKQKWFLLRLVSKESHIRFDQSAKPEFNGWRWVNYWYPVKHVVSFKRQVYQRALAYFLPIIKTIKDSGSNHA